jgi:hypothetical protein
MFVYYFCVVLEKVCLVANQGRINGRASRAAAPGRQAIRGAKTSNMEKYLKKIGLKKRQIISPHGAPTSLGPALS